MVRYLIEFEINPAGFASLLQDPRDREKGTSPMFEALGGKLEHYWFGVGQGNCYVVASLPDAKALEAVTMAVMAGGAVTSVKSTAILTAKEGMAAMKLGPKMGYKFKAM